jgi:hypothetical protein|tara:strand:- start:10 stop:183 length:174 start_codon:yes stop_codon:yes gene_type:complete
MDSEVDVNILINRYHQKLSTLVNQNILLEAKIESLTKDYSILQEKLSNYENQDTENE